MRLSTKVVKSGWITWLLALAGWLAAVDAWGQAKAPEAPRDVSPPTGDATTAVDRSKPVVWQLDIEAPEKLARLLRTYLDLARFQDEAAQDQTLGIRRSELRRLVVSAPDQARSLLEAEGYFNAVIHTRVSEEQAGQPVARQQSAVHF
jgi:translocation and assembly module TamA